MFTSFGTFLIPLAAKSTYLSYLNMLTVLLLYHIRQKRLDGLKGTWYLAAHERRWTVPPGSFHRNLGLSRAQVSDVT